MLLGLALACGGDTVHFPDMTATLGASTANNLAVIRSLHRKMRPARTLEVGLAYGWSAAAFAECHRDAGAKPARQHVAIDPYQLAHLNGAGLDRLSNEGLCDYVEFIEARSHQALPTLANEGRTFDLIYVDGSHLFEDVIIDALYAIQLLRVGGVVLFDDSATRDVQKVLRFLRRNMAALMREMDLSAYRPDLGKPLRYRVAKAIRRNQLTGFEKLGDGARDWRSKLADF